MILHISSKKAKNWIKNKRIGENIIDKTAIQNICYWNRAIFWVKKQNE